MSNRSWLKPERTAPERLPGRDATGADGRKPAFPEQTSSALSSAARRAGRGLGYYARGSQGGRSSTLRRGERIWRSAACTVAKSAATEPGLITASAG